MPPMNDATVAAYLEQLILAERDFAGCCDTARMNLHQPLTQEVLDRMQQQVDCALSRLGAAQQMNMAPVPEVMAAPPVVTPDSAPLEGPTGSEGCCRGPQGCATAPAAEPEPGKIGVRADCGCG
jgi:hypothetical protein